MEIKLSPSRAYLRIFTVTDPCHTRLRVLLVVILLAIATTTTTTAAPITPLSTERKTRMDGWHATDRFSGFRYEIHGTNLSAFKHILRGKYSQSPCLECIIYETITHFQSCDLLASYPTLFFSCLQQKPINWRASGGRRIRPNKPSRAKFDATNKWARL